MTDNYFAAMEIVKPRLDIVLSKQGKTAIDTKPKLEYAQVLAIVARLRELFSTE